MPTPLHLALGILALGILALMIPAAREIIGGIIIAAAICAAAYREQRRTLAAVREVNDLAERWNQKTAHLHLR